MKRNQEKINIQPYLHQFYRGNTGYMILAVLQTLFTTVAILHVSYLMQQIIDLVAGVDIGLTLGEVAWFALLDLVLFLVGNIISYFSMPRFATKASLQYKNYVFSKLTQKGISAFSEENTSSYVSALSNDVNAIEKGYLSSIIIIIEQSAMFVGALCLMFYYNPLLTLISIGVAILPLAVSILTGNLVASAEKKVSSKNESYMSTLRDALVGFSVIKSFRAEKQLYKIFAKETKSLADAKERRNKNAILVETCANASGMILQFGVFLIGAYLALSGSSISAGSVLVFVQLLNFVINPIGAIPQALAECKASKALIRKLARSLEENVRVEGTVEKNTLSNAITVKSLTFSYEENKPVLHDLNFRFEAGKSYCIVGGSGSGKSTLLNLLMASNHGYTGEIFYDETELQSIRGESLYDIISVIQQNVFIFNASIRDNITMFSEFDREDVDRAIRLSGLSELIRERGEDYLCGENGAGLSGGEKQRISIARSLLKKSQVLLVDEATASLDVQTAAQVTGAILGLEGMTRIVITHALDEALLKQYDRILTLKNGCITESGSFEDLMAQKGYFYSLFTINQ